MDDDLGVYAENDNVVGFSRKEEGLANPSGDYIVFTAEKEDNPEGYSQWASSRRFNFTTDVDMPRQFEFRFQPKTGFLGIGFNCS